MLPFFVKTRNGLKPFVEVIRSDGSSEVEVLRAATGEIFVFDAQGRIIGVTQTNGAAIWIKIREPKQFVLYSYLTDNGWRLARQVQRSLTPNLANER